MAVIHQAPGIEALVSELDVLIRSSFSLVAVETHEEPRFRRAIDALSALPRHEKKHVLYWSRPTGLRRKRERGLGTTWEPVEGGEDPIGVLETIAELVRTSYDRPKLVEGEPCEGALFVLCDYAPYLLPLGQEEPEVVRRLRELSWELESTLATVLFVGPSFPQVPSLEREVRVLTLPLPEERELGAMLDLELARLAAREVEVLVDEPTRERIVAGGLGLTASEFSSNFFKSVVSRRGVGPHTVEDLVREKGASVRRMGFEFTPPVPPDHMGGAGALLELIEGMALAQTEAARRYGLRGAKGYLLWGYPGTGKDLFMRVVAHALDKPLLRIEMGEVVGAGGGVLGGGMERLKAAFAVARANGAIVGFSEFEKAFGGLASSNRSDGGETARLIAYVLSYMAEDEGTIFLASANDITELRPEQLRVGRFDGSVFMDLPTEEERAEIFGVHLRLRGRDPEVFDLRALAEGSGEFTGAEIEGAVNGGLLRGFRAGREVTTEDVLEAAKAITPAARLGRGRMEAMLAYAEGELGLTVHRRSRKATAGAAGGERAFQL